MRKTRGSVTADTNAVDAVLATQAVATDVAAAAVRVVSRRIHACAVIIDIADATTIARRSGTPARRGTAVAMPT